jgi:HEAT repeat protein
MMASTEVEARLGAVWTLGKTRDPRAAELLTLMILDSDEKLRASAAGALGKIESPIGIGALVKAADDPSPRVRSASVNALGRIGDASVVDAMVKKLNDPDTFVRNRVLIAIGRLGGPDAADALLGEVALHDDGLDPAFRAIGLGLVGVPGAVAEAVAILKDRAIRSRVEAILTREEPVISERFYENISLGQKGDAKKDQKKLDPSALIIHYAALMRNSPDTEARQQAAIALSRLDDVAALEAVGDAIRHDPDPEVRLAAAQSLVRRSKHPAAKAALLVAATDPIVRVRLVAIEVLGDSVQPEEAQVLLSALRSHHESVRQAAEDAVAAVFAGSIQRFHDWMMGNEDDQVRQSGLRVLARLAQAESLGLVTELLHSQNPAVRIEAGNTLAAINAYSAIDSLFLALTDPIEAVRVGLVHSLAWTGRKDVAERLGEICLDPSAEVRQALADTAGALDHAASIDVLTRLCGDAVPDVAGRALMALMRHANERGPGAALAQWDQSSDDIRRFVRERCDETAVSVATRLMKDLSPERREESVKLLIALDTRRFANEIALGLRDPDAAVRLAAVNGLGTLDVSLVADWIRALLTDPVEEVRVAAKKVLFRSV